MCVQKVGKTARAVFLRSPVKMPEFRRLSGKMVAEAFHCTDYESENEADTATLSNVTIQSADEKVIITARCRVSVVRNVQRDTLKTEAVIGKTNNEEN